MPAKRWVLNAADAREAEVLAAAVGVSPITARLLLNRGVRDPEQARRFLRPELSGLIDPAKFADMPRAVERLRRALREGEKIGIFGDYDVDGTTGTAILVRFFRLLGRAVETCIPHRVEEGYGLNRAAVERFSAAGVKVMITVDCGTANVAEIAFARERGIDVVVVDHHEPQAALPAAHAIVNPKLAGASYPFAGICSAGIAFKLVWALSEGLGASSALGQAYQEFVFDALGYAALGTIADVSPLVDENSVFVTFGLEALRRTRAKGLRALLAKARLADKRIDGFDVAFKIAPRLNAVGRLGKAADTLDLLTTESDERVAEIIELIESANIERRAIEGDIARQAMEQVRNHVDLDKDRVIVVADSRWHPGVVGIVAARLVDEFYRPSFVLAIDGDLAKGSARSIEGFPLHEAMESCGFLLTTHGGHAMAAGVSLPRENLGAFRQALNAYAEKILTPDDFRPSVKLDDEVRLGHMTEALVREIGHLAPHGPGNPPPIFAARGARIAGAPRLMGKKSDHVSFHVAHDGPALRAVGFGLGRIFDDLSAASTCSLAFTPEMNEWNGRESVELKVKDIQF